MGISDGVIEKVKGVGAEPPTKSVPQDPPAGSAPPKKRDKRKLWNWLLGFTFSCLPVLSGPFVMLLFKEPIVRVCVSALTDISIIYIGVSLIVSAMNDLEPEEQGRKNMYIVILAFAVSIYTLINVAQRFASPGVISTGFIITMNVAFLAISLVFGLNQYLRKDGGVGQ